MAVSIQELTGWLFPSKVASPGAPNTAYGSEKRQYENHSRRSRGGRAYQRTSWDVTGSDSLLSTHRRLTVWASYSTRTTKFSAERNFTVLRNTLGARILTNDVRGVTSALGLPRGARGIEPIGAKEAA